jgi:hypothetical protein
MASTTRKYFEPFVGLMGMNVVNYQNRDKILSILKNTIEFSFEYVSDQ